MFYQPILGQNDYSDLWDWEAHSNVDYGGINNCSATTSFKYWGSNAMTQQSPLIASSNPYWDCNDRHTTHNFVSCIEIQVGLMPWEY